VSRQPAHRTVTGAALAMVAVAMPPFLIGAMSVGLADGLGTTTGAVATRISIGYLIATVFSPVGGRCVERITPPIALRLACGLATAGVVVLLARASVPSLTAAFVLFGLANAVIQPASNGTLATVRAPRTQGVQFGIVQSAIPGAILLCGLVLTLVNDPALWRPALWALLAVTVVPQLLITAGPGRRSSIEATATSVVPRLLDPRLTLLLVGSLLGSAAATTLALFSVRTGLATGAAPLVVTTTQMVGSLCCITARVGTSWRWGAGSAARLIGIVALLQLTGALGMLLIAGGGVASYVVGLCVGLGCGWGWTALLNLALVRIWPGRTPRVTGVIQAALFAGSVAAPLLFSWLDATAGRGTAWAVSALELALAALACAACARRLRSDEPSALGDPAGDLTPETA
jgi:MFS family permease